MHINSLFHGSKLNRHDLLQLIQLVQQRKQLNYIIWKFGIIYK
jgi:hypothetical protein